MISVGGRSELAPAVVRSMHRFRHETFVGRLQWSLPLLHGVEKDQYDNEDAVYFIVHDVHEDVTACARLLPTTSSYMLPELFAELLGGNPPPRDPATWELSRFATSVRKSREGRVLALSGPTLNLLDAIFQFARDNAVRRLLLVTSIAIERLLLRERLEVHRIGPPVRMPDELIVALIIEVAGAACAGERIDRAAPGRPRDSSLEQRARRIETLYARAHFGIST
jgi:acyl homoserine lactone synthase